MKNILLAIIFIFLFECNVVASEYAVVANKNMPQLSKAQVKAIFLKKMLVTHDIKIVPINLSPRDPLRISFEKHILKTNFRRLKSYWMKQHYLGHRPPVSLKSQKSSLAFLKKVDGAITYIDIKNIDNTMNIILRWSN
ncbi:hypothetical protein JHD48_09425 [Sulfurimonas sp. SAG-AH-194-I05]|nr:hypothetical protein [Sulfurimonas sp. SAG-AH-194-I05]MDF1875954.1 hypothetical protein [Sulfurimonas sp. SAG-AH-194-I05]